MVNGKQLNAWFASPVEYTGESNNQKQFREMVHNIGTLLNSKDI